MWLDEAEGARQGGGNGARYTSKSAASVQLKQNEYVVPLTLADRCPHQHDPPIANSGVCPRCFNEFVEASVLVARPDRIERMGVAVME